MSFKVVFGEDSPNFKKLSKKENNPAKRVRLIAMALLKNGSKIHEVATVLGLERHSIGRWYRRYKEHGLSGLSNQPRSGRKPKLSREQEKEFVQEVVVLQNLKTGGRITGYDIQEMALEKFGAKYAEDSIYKVLNRLGLSWITSRSRHPKTDPVAQAAFKKTLNRK